MSVEEAIKYFELVLEHHLVEREDITPLRTLINAVKNSISKKDKIREKINERQFELQQEFKDFKDDVRLNTLQEIYYLNEEG